ncbi:MAG TPA: proline racemase family protein [Candidatus Acidoferrales bacterium]|nr:proline racemase family protein [Candidatus Acidoferrales bacterium]
MKTQNLILVVETHSSGETTKVVMSGFPKLEGNSMWEKTKFCEDRYDNLRKTLMSQPRGFSGILGAIVTEPTNKEADFGLVFIYSGGYFHSCGDSTFSVTKALLEQGMVQIEEPITRIVYDTAAGVVRAEAEVKNGVVGRISFDAPTAFYQESTVVDVPDVGKIHADIASGGLYYAIVDAEEVGVKVQPENARKLTTIGMKILDAANAQVKVRHPEKPDLNKLELVTFSAKPAKADHHFKHANVYSDTICVSPAGTSVGAKLATLVAKGKLRVGEEMIVESLVHPDLIMVGKATSKTKFGDYVAVTPRLSAHAYVIGTQQCIIESGDPIGHGFVLS